MQLYPSSHFFARLDPKYPPRHLFIIIIIIIIIITINMRRNTKEERKPVTRNDDDNDNNIFCKSSIENKASVEDKPGTTAIKAYEDKQWNISG
jgi:hypothetical protein